MMSALYSQCALSSLHQAQVELHPLLAQRKLVGVCARRGVTCVAYSPLGHSKQDLLEHPAVLKVAEELGKSPAQVGPCDATFGQDVWGEASRMAEVWLLPVACCDVEVTNGRRPLGLDSE